MIRIQADRIEGDLAAQRLLAEGIPAQVVSDSDMLAVAGTPMPFSIVVPAHLEANARKFLSQVEKPRRKRR
jgi:hypothetical protein